MSPSAKLSPAEETRYAELQQLALDAARNGDEELLLPMLAAGLPVNLADGKGNSLVMLSAYYGHAPLVRILLEKGAAPDQRNDRNQTPLAGVAFKGGLEIVKLLVAHGADPRADQGGGRCPIHFAAMFGHPDIVAYLHSLEVAERPSKRLRAMAFLTGFVRRQVWG